MRPDEPRLQLASLRRSFDESFAQPATQTTIRTEDLLHIGVAGRAYAVRLSELAGIRPVRSITPFPTLLPTVIGAVGFRGALVVIFDLALILGHARTEHPRWLALAASAPLALAFDVFEGRHDAAAESVTPLVSNSGAPRYCLESVQVDGVSRLVLDVAQLIAGIQKRAEDR